MCSLPFAAIIENQIFCVHSGIGTNLWNIQQIEKLQKPFHINHNDPTSIEQKLAFDMLWSDPVLDINDT